jgi:excisionase family DNA binding protein
MTRAAEIPANTPWLTVLEAAAYIRRSNKMVYEMIAAGEIPAYNRGGRLIKKEDLDAWILEARVF